MRGLLAGLIAGLLAGVFAFAFGEPKVDAAIAIEEAAAPPAAADEEPPLVSRDGQKAGLFLATGLYGVALGGLFAVGFALLRRRLRTPDDTRAALGLAAAGLVGVVLVPWVKYPPNPPAVGDPSTIDQRTASYLAILVIGVVAVWASVLAFRSLRSGAAEWLRLTAGLGAFLLVVVIGFVLLPNIDEVSATFPASLLWNFRLTSLGTQVVMWAVLGLTFGALTARRRSPVTEAEMRSATV
ncbi:CbtA family protein [Actinoplanes sp. NBRC 103695]|uniref:CbtA family protein n=1 Tax=Actinoplanes sp. NBRC 103695 TaxID=3032202 RepID=UPI0025557010|nr:CbtA family protein [Actinoplanes sp. NBRC 103695]